MAKSARRNLLNLKPIMRAKFLLIFILIGFIGVKINESTHLTEIEASIFVKESSVTLNEINNEIVKKLYDYNNNEEDLSDSLKPIIQSYALNKLVEISKKAKGYDLTAIKDPELKFALKRISEARRLFILEDEKFTDFIYAINNLQNSAKYNDIEPYGLNDSDERLALDPEINRIIANSQNPDELKYYWEEWRNYNENNWNDMADIIQYFQKAANKTGIPVLKMWFHCYDDLHILDEMEKVMTQLKPFYMQLHAFVRNELVTKYGDSIVRPDGPIPAHLYEQVLIQAWKNNSILESVFPISKLPKFDKGLEDKGYGALNILEAADDFYKSLGLEPLEKDFGENRLKPVDDDEGDDSCKADIYDGTSRVYMKYCKKVDFKKFLQSHSWMGSLHYASQKKELPYYFFDSYGLEYPVGEAVLLSASSLKHLQSREIISELKPDDDVLTNRLFRMCIHTMFNIPLYFIHSKVINDALIQKVKVHELNKFYWKLMEDYAGIEPPSDRIDQIIDAPYKFYENVESNFPTRKFVSEILGYQFYKALCEKSGQLNDAPLHNCDFYGNHAVGDSLREMMKLGSSKPWRETISNVVPNENGLDGSAILEYYKPISEWLQEQNKISGVKIGWEHTKRKV